MADGQLKSIWSQLLHTKRTLSPVRLVLKVKLLYRGVSLYVGSIIQTRLDDCADQEAYFNHGNIGIAYSPTAS